MEIFKLNRKKIISFLQMLSRYRFCRNFEYQMMNFTSNSYRCKCCTKSKQLNSYGCLFYLFFSICMHWHSIISWMPKWFMWISNDVLRRRIEFVQNGKRFILTVKCVINFNVEINQPVLMGPFALSALFFDIFINAIGVRFNTSFLYSHSKLYTLIALTSLPYKQWCHKWHVAGAEYWQNDSHYSWPNLLWSRTLI